MNRYQTGGEKRQWLFDPADAENIRPIANHLIHEDVYFEDLAEDTVLTKVLDTLLAEVTPEEREAINLVYITGLSFRKAAAIVGVDHKTVSARCRRGIASMRRRLVDSVWIADLLAGMVPADEVPAQPVDVTATASAIIGNLKRPNSEQS
jgi:DNA-directed RNA polymerase specialized sigma24 family protein